MQVSKMSPLTGAEVTGIDLTKPVDAEAKRRLNRALADNIAVVIRDQSFDAKQFYEACTLFGEPVASLRESLEKKDAKNNISNAPYVHQISSHDRNEDGSLKKTGPVWHTDQSSHKYPPKFTILYAIELFRTGGGSSGIANTRAAFESLPDDLRQRVDGMNTANVITGPDPVILPLVRTNAENGKKALYFHPGRVENIVGMTPDDSHKLLEDLLERILKPEFFLQSPMEAWRYADLG